MILDPVWKSQYGCIIFIPTKQTHLIILIKGPIEDYEPKLNKSPYNRLEDI